MLYNKIQHFIDGWNKNKNECNEGLTLSNGEKGIFTKGNEIWKKRPLKKVKCVESGIVYSSIDECAKAMNLKKFSIYKVCNGQRKTYKNMKFEYVL